MWGVGFPVRHPHEGFHVDPLRRRLSDIASHEPAVVVHADTRSPTKGAWNVQLFHGLGDKQYTANPLYLQRGRHPKARTAAAMALRRLRIPNRLLAAPSGRRQARYEQVNAYGPRMADRLSDMLDGCYVSRFGHVGLNERGGIRVNKRGPIVWSPTWDNRRYMGGTLQSSLGPFAEAVAALATDRRVIVKPHPLTIVHNQSRPARSTLAATTGVGLQPAQSDPYDVLQGASLLLTDTGSLGFEAASCGLPVVVLKASDWRLGGLHTDLEEHAPVCRPGEDLVAAIDAARPAPRAWRVSLLEPPKASRNDAFADELRGRAGG